jgi:hypothetical protein
MTNPDSRPDRNDPFPSRHADEGKPPPSEGLPDKGRAVRKDLPPAARRALREAEERRAARDAEAAKAGSDGEVGGPGGPEPVRYGDWEAKGRAIDF